MTVLDKGLDEGVVVVGAGYVGLPLGLALCEAGRPTTFYDRDEGRIRSLKRGESYISDVLSERLRVAQSGGGIAASSNPSVLTKAAVVVVSVPTPLGKTREPDLTFVEQALEDIAAYQHPGMLVIVESTVYPGMTREIVVPRLTRGFELGKDVFIAYSPERLDPGNPKFNLVNTPKVVSGATPACLEKVIACYSSVFAQLVPVSSTDTAEMVKLLENTFRAVNVGLVNELAIAARKLGLDPFEVTRAAATKPFGFMPFSPGPGVGGHCIPVDPLYLRWKLVSLHHEAKLISAADSVNSSMPAYVVQRLQGLLGDTARPLAGARILIYGVTYKANVPDARESPAIAVMAILRERGALVSYMDPYVELLQVVEENYQGVPTTTEFASFDAVVVLTAHDGLPRARMCQQAKLILDTRDVFFEERAVHRHIHSL